MFYTNVDRIGKYIMYRGYGSNGKPIQRQVMYTPTLYVKSQQPTRFTTLSGQHVAPIQPGNMWDCKQFVEKYDGVDGFEIYGNQNYVHQFISDVFSEDEIKWDSSLINVTSIDIEVHSTEGFPHAEHADYPITVITIKNNNSDVFESWGLGPWDSAKSVVPQIHVNYRQYDDEISLLYDFLYYWKNNYPDVITGWNSRMFDMVYVINRIAKLLGDQQADMISPWGNIRSREIFINGKPNPVYEISGIQQLDYLDLFKKFGYTYGAQENYKLDTIANVVLGERKLNYEEYGSLRDLWEQNPQLYIDYNFKDVDIVDRLEDKLGLIRLCMTIAYYAKVNFAEAFGTVSVWDAIIYNVLRKQNIVVPPKRQKHKEGNIQGAHVKDPKPGYYKWLISFDLNSLYPHIIMQYNLSPETITEQTIPITVGDLLENKQLSIPTDSCMTARGNVVRTDEEGIVPGIIEKLYAQRSSIKKQMLTDEQQLVDVEAEIQKRSQDISNQTATNLSQFTQEQLAQQKKQLEKQVATLGNQQMAIKILMNSLYGGMSNEFFRYFDIRLAESITLTGQLTIRWAEKTLNNFMNKYLNTTDIDYVIAIDTDSLYISVDDFVQRNYADKTRAEITDIIDAFAKETIEPVLDQSYQQLATYLQCPKQKMVMKREVIADQGIWTGKKHYVLNALDVEGVRYATPKIKMTGIEAVKSSTPKFVRDLIKDTIASVFEKDEITVQQMIEQKRQEFASLNPADVSFPRSVNSLSKYKHGDKAIPIAVRGALTYNQLLKEHGLDKRYQTIDGGDKIKFCYLKMPNKVGSNVIAFQDYLPKELDLDQDVDYNKQFEKSFVEPIRGMVESRGWRVEKRNKLALFMKKETV